jgi:hypothetical protein
LDQIHTGGGLIDPMAHLRQFEVAAGQQPTSSAGEWEDEGGGGEEGEPWMLLRVLGAFAFCLWVPYISGPIPTCPT